MKTGIVSLLARLHRDEQGAEAVEKLLLVAMIVLPLLGVIIYFRDKLTDFVSQKWQDITGRADPTPNAGN
jgi:Flp pilus assembly pilin Flp